MFESTVVESKKHKVGLQRILTLPVSIALHVIVATRSKAFASGRISLDRGYVRLLFIVILLVFISILIATLPGAVLLTR